MSGIAGIIHFNGAPVEAGQIAKMTSAMAHRGPDGIRHWVKGNVAFGQCMLRTTPESLEETQPLTNEDESLVLVMDGRVDNWEELRRELLERGAVLRTRADAELVLRAYEVWGLDCLEHIDGDFAWVIWDARQKRAFCARDRMGNKPLHYHWNGKTLAFASELHPILALPWVREEPNEGMLSEFLAGEWHSRDETLWQGIMRLVAAHRMVIDASGPRPEQFWAPDLWAKLPYSKDEDYIEHYRELFADAVRRMSRSHRPIACEVSGGLDSSAVFCMAEHLSRTKQLLAPGIEGYTLAFSDDSDANELAYAKAVSEYLGVTIHEVPPSLMPLAWYEQNARTFREFPGFPNGSMFMDLRLHASKRGSRVILTGEWGDAWLQGSRTYYAEELAQWKWRKLRDCFRTDTAERGAKQATKWFIRHGVFPLLPQAFQQNTRWVVQKVRAGQTKDALYWLPSAMQTTFRLRREKSHPLQPTKVRSVYQRELLDMLYSAFASQAMERLERLGAHAGLEIRHPFSDPRIVQLAFSTPERMRLRGDRSKYVHVQAMQGLMPQAILDRKTKADFATVFRRLLAEAKQTLIEKIPQEHPAWVTEKGVAKLFRVFEENPQSGWPLWILWAVLNCDSVFKKKL